MTTMTKTRSPSEAEPEERAEATVYDGPDDGLWDHLQRAAYRAMGQWARVSLPDGLQCAARRREKDWRREVIVSRAEVDDAGDLIPDVQRRLPHLLRGAWYMDEVKPPRGAALRFVELWRGEVAPGRMG